MNSQIPNKPPIVTRKKFQVIAEIEVTVFEMPRTVQETELFDRVNYKGQGVEEFLDAENALMVEMLNSPDDLRAWLSYRATCATELEHHVFDDWQSGEELLQPAISRLSNEQQHLLSRSVNEAFYHAVETHINSVRVEEKAS